MTYAHRVALGLAAFTAIAPLAAKAQSQSGFDCSAYEFSTALPSVEGKEGVFFRTFADLRLQHPMDQRTILLLGRLTEVLAENGTTLVYVTIPAKSQAMADYLPERANDYGFDAEMAEQIYTDIITRMSAVGIVAPDVMTALQNVEGEERAFFGADFHWTSGGARAAAKAIADAMKQHPSFADLTSSTYESKPIGKQVAFSGMRRSLQGFCKDALPPTETMAYKTDPVESPAEQTGDLDIFAGGSDTALPAVLVGTSFSDSPINNFIGFLTEYTGLDVINYSITGGNQFGAMTSYLTSDEFKEQRPRFLIWENPIYNNLAQYGSAPLEELIAAAGTSCTKPLNATKVDEFTISASLEGINVGPDDAIFADFGQEGARAASFSLETADGIIRKSRIERGQRLRGTGNFYLGMSPFHHPSFKQVSVRFNRAVTDATTLTICTGPKGDAL
jgi:alginate biosynthesis protein AlgX